MEYIRGSRKVPFLSVKDLAVTIVKRCATVFTSDAKLLSPDPFLLEIYQKAIGDVVWIFYSSVLVSRMTDSTKSAKEAKFFKKFNASLDYLSHLYDRVSGQSKHTESRFRDFARDRVIKFYNKDDDDLSSDGGGNIIKSRRNLRRIELKLINGGRVKRGVQRAMANDPEKEISRVLYSFNNITQETAQLIEIKDIIDELKIIREVQEEQIKVMEDFTANLDQQREVMQLFVGHEIHKCREIEALSKKAEDTLNAVTENVPLELIRVLIFVRSINLSN